MGVIIGVDFVAWNEKPSVAKALRDGAKAIDKKLIEIALGSSDWHQPTDEHETQISKV